jgi:hypothetical protein
MRLSNGDLVLKYLALYSVPGLTNETHEYHSGKLFSGPSFQTQEAETLTT